MVRGKTDDQVMGRQLRDSATPVSDDYTAKDSSFTGRGRWVQIDLGEDAEHLTSPEERYRVAVAVQ